MANTYTKLRDGWGVRATAPVKQGDTISVTTKAGQVKTERVARVLWTGPDKRTGERIFLVAIAPRAAAGGPSSSSYGNRAPGGRVCPECGSRGCAKAWNSNDLCDED